MPTLSPMSVPVTPPRNPLMTNVSRMSRSVSIPSRLDVVVSSATARSALPVRVAFMRYVKSASITIDTPKMTTWTVRTRTGWLAVPKFTADGRFSSGSG